MKIKKRSPRQQEATTLKDRTNQNMLLLSYNSSPVQDEMTVNMALHRGVKTKERNMQQESRALKPTRVTCKPSTAPAKAELPKPVVEEGFDSQDETVVVSGGPNSFQQ